MSVLQKSFGQVRIPQLWPVQAAIARWLRFDPTNHRGLIIKANTYLYKADGSIKKYLVDTAVDFTSLSLQAGKDYGVYLLNDDSVTAVLLSGSAPANSVKIGRFHTLCNAAGTMTMIAPSRNLSAGGYYLIKSYDAVKDPDFYSFYRKAITAVTSQTQYDVATMQHPLSGYASGDILPESVFCLTFYPECLNEDGMVYDQDTGRAVDIYLQSGEGHNTKSVYGGTHTVSRSPWNHQENMRMVGKRLLTDHEFTSAAIGSNERTNITGSSDKTTVGGHVDTNNRRMISAIGCEEMCGYLWQWLDEIAAAGGSQWEENVDGHDSFGQNYGKPYVLLAGGYWSVGVYCGSRSRDARHDRAVVGSSGGGRGSSRVQRGWK